ncbi:MAG: hypothetical protein NVSMB21_26250 [Vulcanimicrobiaceae bacterium]
MTWRLCGLPTRNPTAELSLHISRGLSEIPETRRFVIDGVEARERVDEVFREAPTCRGIRPDPFG